MGKHVHQPGGGRHRYGLPGLVHVADLHNLAARLAGFRPSLVARFRDGSRHAPAVISRSGFRPRPAFVLIASM